MTSHAGADGSKLDSSSGRVASACSSKLQEEVDCEGCRQLQQQVQKLQRDILVRSFNEEQALKSLRAMEHESVGEDILMVDRKRNSIQSATMKTEGILGHIHPGEVYKTTDDNLVLVPDAERQALLTLPEPVTPRMIVIENGFQNSAGAEGQHDNNSADELAGDGKGNILGVNTLFLTKDPSYVVPKAEMTPEDYAYYGAHLLPVGSQIQFETPQVVPFTKMVVGERYVESYLLNKDYGGGFYIEYHNCPHYHQPLNANSKGWLILGKFTEDQKHIRLSAFKIPLGYGVYMPPGVLHCDAYLTGEYLVAYTAAKEFKTGLFRMETSMEPTKIRVWCEFTQKMWPLKETRRSFFISQEVAEEAGISLRSLISE